MAMAGRKGRAVSVYYVGYDFGVGLGSLIWGVLIEVLGYSLMFWTGILLLFLVAVIGIRMEEVPPK